MTDNAGTIASFLKGKGLSDTATAGVLGNLQVESGLNPTSSNPREGAIGLAQWENGRRTNLQAYAAAHGGKETDLGMQLGFMWSELTGGYSGALSNLKAAPTPAAAATVWDTQYEKSAGTTRAARVADAQQYAAHMPGGSGLGWGTLAALAAPVPTYAAGALGSAAAGAVGDATSGVAGAVGTQVTKAGVYLLAFGLGGTLLVLGLNKAAGNPAGKTARLAPLAAL